MAVRDFFQKDEEEVVVVVGVEEEEEEGEGRSLRVEEEGLSLGLLWSAADGEGSGSERRRREGSRESALWSVTMSRARAASPASAARSAAAGGGRREDMGVERGFLWGRRRGGTERQTAKGSGADALLGLFVGFAILLFTPRWACLVVLDLFLNFWLSWNWDLGDSNSCLALCDGDGFGNGMGASEELVKKEEDMAAWRRVGWVVVAIVFKVWELGRCRCRSIRVKGASLKIV
jgi:hypothetical protein